MDPPKGKKVVTAILHENAAKALRFQRDELTRRGWYRPNGPVFPAKLGEWRSNHCVVPPEQSREFAREAGVKDADRWVTHCFRHTFCSFEAVGGDLKTAQSRARHASMQQTEHYIHQLGEGLPQPGIGALPGADGLFGGDDEAETAPEMALAPVPDLTLTMQARRAQIDQARADVRAARNERKADWAREKRVRPTPLLDLALQHPVGIPPEVVAMADKRYQLAYRAAQRAGSSPADIKDKATKARHALLGTFKRLQNQHRRGV